MWKRKLVAYTAGAVIYYLLSSLRFTYGGDDALLIRTAVAPDPAVPFFVRAHVSLVNRSDRPVYFEPCRGRILMGIPIGWFTTGPRCFQNERLVLQPGEVYRDQVFGANFDSLSPFFLQVPGVSVRYRTEPEGPFTRVQAPFIKLPLP